MLKISMQLDSETKNYEYMTAIFLLFGRQYLVQGVHQICKKVGALLSEANSQWEKAKWVELRFINCGLRPLWARRILSNYLINICIYVHFAKLVGFNLVSLEECSSIRQILMMVNVPHFSVLNINSCMNTLALRAYVKSATCEELGWLAIN
jgi:hypothetical protein